MKMGIIRSSASKHPCFDNPSIGGIMTALRIIFVCSNTTAIGGAARSSKRVINNLRHLGHLVIQVSPDEGVFPNERVQTQHHWLFSPSRGLQQHCDEVLRAIKVWKPDIVLGWYGSSGGFVAVSASAQCSVPSIVCLRGNDIDLDFFRPDRHALLTWTLQKATAISCVSTRMTHKVHRWFEKESTFIPNAVDSTLFYSDPSAGDRFRAQHQLRNTFTLGIFGELKPKRGLDLLSKLSKELQHWQLLIIGRVRPSVAHQLPPNCRVIEYITDDEDLRSAYNACDVVLQPSHHDGMPNVVLEALACGVSVLASKVGGLTDIYQPDCSLILCESVEDWISSLRKQRSTGDTPTAPTLRTPIQEAQDYVKLISSAIDLYTANSDSL